MPNHETDETRFVSMTEGEYVIQSLPSRWAEVADWAAWELLVSVLQAVDGPRPEHQGVLVAPMQIVSIREHEGALKYLVRWSVILDPTDAERRRVGALVFGGDFAQQLSEAAGRFRRLTAPSQPGAVAI